MLHRLSTLIENGIKGVHELEQERTRIQSLPLFKKEEAICDHLLPKCEEFRAVVDQLENLVDDAYWPLPKYRELLFMI
jgi:glutamine synthetase